jgi:ribonuclease D
LNNNQKEKAKKIFYIRERYAEKYNLPPHNLLENSIIITLTMGKAQIEEVRLYKKIPEQTKKAIKKEIIACLNT